MSVGEQESKEKNISSYNLETWKKIKYLAVKRESNFLSKRFYESNMKENKFIWNPLKIEHPFYFLQVRKDPKLLT